MKFKYLIYIQVRIYYKFTFLALTDAKSSVSLIKPLAIFNVWKYAYKGHAFLLWLDQQPCWSLPFFFFFFKFWCFIHQRFAFLILIFKTLHWNIIYLDNKLFWGGNSLKNLHSKRCPWSAVWSWLCTLDSSSTFLPLFLLLWCLQVLWACLVAQISTRMFFCLFCCCFFHAGKDGGDLCSLTRDGTCAPCSRRKLRVFNHWTTRKVSRENVLRREISRQKLSCLEWPVLGSSTLRPSCRPDSTS